MSTKEAERRLQELERRHQAAGSRRPLYVGGETPAAAAAAAALVAAQHGPGPLKVYVGVSPDDWDTA